MPVTVPRADYAALFPASCHTSGVGHLQEKVVAFFSPHISPFHCFVFKLCKIYNMFKTQKTLTQKYDSFVIFCFQTGSQDPIASPKNS